MKAEGTRQIKHLIISGGIEHIFNTESILDSNDIIALVRSKFPDPRVVVVVEPVNVKLDSLAPTLAEANIFVKGVNSEDANFAVGVGANPCIVCDLDSLPNISKLCTGNSKDYAQLYSKLRGFVSEASIKYGVQDVSVLVLGSDTNALVDCLNATRECRYSTGFDSMQFFFPAAAKKKVMSSDDTIDINKYASKIKILADSNGLDSKKLHEVLDELQIESMKKEKFIPGSDSSASRYSKWLLLYLALNCGLAPKMTPPFLNAIRETRIMYPVDKMSLHERLFTMQSLPSLIGLISCGTSLVSICQIVETVFPEVYGVFDLRTGNLCKEYGEYSKVQADGKAFPWSDFVICNVETFFPKEDQKPGVQETAISQNIGNPNLKQAHELLKLFYAVSKNIPDRKAFVSIKNSVLAYKKAEGKGNLYLIYCPTLGVCKIKLMNSITGWANYALDESEFFNFLDYKYAAAIDSLTVSERFGDNANKFDKFQDIATGNESHFDPPIPLEEMMCAELCKPDKSGLSFFRKGLRTGVNITPIINTPESDPLIGERGKSDFDYRPILFTNYFGDAEDLCLRDVVGDGLKHNFDFINCFGTSNYSAINFTMDAWRK